MRGPALALVLLASCGGASIAGSVGGVTFGGSAAVSRDPVVSGKELHQVTVTIAEVESSYLCRDLGGKRLEKGATYLHFDFGKQGPLEAGDYAIGGEAITSARWALAKATSLDDACKDTLARQATGGTITLDSWDDAGMKGSFALKFGEDSLAGSFSTETCDATTLPATPECL